MLYWLKLVLAVMPIAVYLFQEVRIGWAKEATRDAVVEEQTTLCNGRVGTIEGQINSRSAEAYLAGKRAAQSVEPIPPDFDKKTLICGKSKSCREHMTYKAKIK